MAVRVPLLVMCCVGGLALLATAASADSLRAAHESNGAEPSPAISRTGPEDLASRESHEALPRPALDVVANWPAGPELSDDRGRAAVLR